MLLEVETDKAVVEIEAQADGIARRRHRQGRRRRAGRPDDRLAAEGRAKRCRPRRRAGADRPQDGRGAAPPRRRLPRPRRQPGVGRRRAISPKARKLAREHGVDIATVTGSGPGGEILADDIMKAATSSRRRVEAPAVSARRAAPATVAVQHRRRRPAPPASSWPGRRRQLHRPHHGRADDAELDQRPALLRDARRRCHRAQRRRARQLMPAIEKSHGVKVTHTDLMVAAVARGAAQAPAHERQLDRTAAITLNPDVNVALAMAVENAVVTAVIKQRRPAGARRHRQAAQRAGRARARRQAAAGRHLRRDVHDQQPRHVRRRRVHGDHRAAAGRRFWRSARSPIASSPSTA